MSFEPGTRLGRYEVESLIGAGGMGEVYLANDVQLERPVALKVLSAEIASDAQRLQRFLQEARTASRLRSEHAAHIYDVGSTPDGAHFIAMEYVEGKPLDKLIDNHPLEVSEVVRIGIQIAEALEEAHARGITHRDIKPANVIITPRGQAKVLDFGLAKLASANGDGELSSSSEIATQVRTNPGMVMGTVSYMSPEQALAERDIDHRTDIYSLGVVLYEMATGRVPFAGESAPQTLNRIVHELPEAMARFNYHVPPDLDVIVKKALRKKRDERYQSVHDMLVDLRSLKEELDYLAQQHRSVPPNLRTGASGGTSNFESDERATLMLNRDAASGAGAARTASLERARTVTAVEGQRTSEREQRRRGLSITLVVAALVAVACVGGGYALYRLAAARRPASSVPFASLQNMKLMRLPASALTTYASISPDGKYLVRVAYEAGNQSIRLRQVTTASEREIVPPTDDYFLGATFSPDGNFIYYPRGKRGQGWRELYRVSVLGGDPQKLIFDIDSPVTISPDGKRLAFKRHVPKNNEDNLLTANEDGSGEQPLVVRKMPVSIGTTAWSPDGRSIAYVLSGRDKEGYYVDIEEVNVSDKSTRKILSGRWREIRSIAWLSDSSGLVITARDRASLPSEPVQIWFVSYPEGQAQKVTNDVNAYASVSLTSDGRSILALQGNDSSQIWLAPGGDSARARQITSNGINGAPVWTPDGRIVYYSNASGNGDIWMMNPDGSASKQLTFDQNNDTMPSVSSDGRHIVFISNRSVGWGIWRMNADGSNAKELVRNVDRDSHPHWSPDSQWVFYNSRDDAGRLAYWKVSAEGGEPLKVADENISYSRLSPDGKLFLTLYRDHEPDSPLKIHLIPAEGGEPVRRLDAPQAIDQINWSPDGQAVDFVITQEGVSNIWRMPLSGGKPKQLTDWKTDFIGWYSWSRDGKQLAAARGTSTTEMVLIKDFR